MTDPLTQRIVDAINSYDADAPRTRQSREGFIGPSDLGFCRQKATLTLRNVEPTDLGDPEGVLNWAADVGTAVHTFMDRVFGGDPNVILGSSRGRLTATFPCGATVSGSPDLIFIDENAVIDVKTKNGLAMVRRHGPSANDRYQRHTYALAALQDGLVSADGLRVGNLYLDRSGAEKVPFLSIEDFDDSLTREIDNWITDVIYAVRYGEDAARDIPAPVCEQICEFFTACRGALTDTHEPVLLRDTETIRAIDTYVEAREMEAEAKRMKTAAAIALRGINGSDGRYQVRHTVVPESEVPGYYRAGFERLDIRPVRHGNR